jgi:hypothetical protein
MLTRAARIRRAHRTTSTITAPRGTEQRIFPFNHFMQSTARIEICPSPSCRKFPRDRLLSPGAYSSTQILRNSNKPVAQRGNASRISSCSCCKACVVAWKKVWSDVKVRTHVRSNAVRGNNRFGSKGCLKCEDCRRRKTRVSHRDKTSG